MYKTQSDSHQITFQDFNQSCGMQLDMDNQWVHMAAYIPWAQLEAKYAEMFPSKTGCPAKPLRMALGSLIIQKRLGVSDRKLVAAIAENPYLLWSSIFVTVQPTFLRMTSSFIRSSIIII